MILKNNLDSIGKAIFCVDISYKSNIDLCRWTQDNNNNNYLLNIQQARDMAIDIYYLHLENANRRTVLIKKLNFNFIIISDDTIQYQLLEAILEQIIKKFLESYEKVIDAMFTGIENMFSGFQSLIPPLFQTTITNHIIWITANCSICNQSHDVCVRKSLIKNATHYPVSLVYKHQGHGILLYIDGNYKLRGQEVVEITG